MRVSLRLGVSAEQERSGEDERSASEGASAVESLDGDGEGSLIGFCGEASILSGLAVATAMCDTFRVGFSGSGRREGEVHLLILVGEKSVGWVVVLWRGGQLQSTSLYEDEGKSRGGLKGVSRPTLTFFHVASRN